MSLTRRGFLIGCSITGLFTVAPILAHALAGPNKYEKILAIHDQVIQNPGDYALHDEFLGAISGSEFELVNSDREIKEVRRLFDASPEDRKEFHSRILTASPEALDSTFAIAVMRDVLNIHRIKLEPSQLKYWQPFADKYQSLILRA